MAPERSVVVPGRAHTPREVQMPRNHQDVGAWPLPARIVRQIRREVARTGRSLQRLEVRGAVIDNFDALGPPSPPSPRSPTPAAYDDSVFFKCKEELDESEDQNDDDDAMCRDEMKLESMEAQGTEDSDLTSLSWLQDRNLLKSITLTKSENGELRPMSQQSIKSESSPTSDYLEESIASEPGGDSSGSTTSDHAPSVSPPLLIPQSHRVHQNGYHNNTSNNNKTNGNASKLKHPHNVPYNPLVHTQNKPPYSFSCLIFMAIEDSPVKALPVKEIYAWIVQHFPYFRNAPSGWKNSVRHNLSLNKCFQKVEKAPSLGKGSLWMVDDQYRSNLMQAFSRAPFHPCVPSANPSPPAPTLSPLSTTPSQSSLPNESRVSSVSPVRGTKGAPNPQLFPFLARRLAANEPPEPPSSFNHSHHENSCDSMSDEMVAAAMVLALKHGPSVLTPAMASYAIQDHTYSVATTTNSNNSNNSLPLSPAEDSEGDEQRKTAEALLHLAGITTSPHPYTQTQPIHRPRLLTRTPKRPNNSASPLHLTTTENNNHLDYTDYNLHNKMKRPRSHQTIYQHHLP